MRTVPRLILGFSKPRIVLGFFSCGVLVWIGEEEREKGEGKNLPNPSKTLDF
jgi:hypothetical protein